MTNKRVGSNKRAGNFMVFDQSEYPKMEVLPQVIWRKQMNGRKNNKRGGSNKGMVDGFFFAK